MNDVKKVPPPPPPRKPALKDYYKVLGIAPGVSEEDLEKAYGKARMLSETNPLALRDVETAYSILKDPEMREQYNAALEKMRSAEASGMYKMTADAKFVAAPSTSSPAIVFKAPEPVDAAKSRRSLLIKVFAAVLVLAVAGGVYLYMQMGYKMKSFSVGDALYDPAGKAFGTISEIDSNHEFAPGKKAKGVLIKKQDGSEVWFPYYDVQANYNNHP